MRKNKKSTEDPIVEEIREIRRRLWAEAGQSVSRYIKLIDELSRKAAEKKRSTRKARSSTKPGKAKGRS